MSDDALEELEDGKTALTSGNRPSLSRRQLIWIGIGLGTAYGLFARVMFGLEKTGAVFELMSTSFIFGVPSALGYARFEGRSIRRNSHRRPTF